MEKSLKDLIARLPIPGLKESTNRHVVSEILTNELGIAIRPKQILIKDGILSVAVPPVVKSAIQMRQELLREALHKEGIDIRTFR